MPTFYTKHLNPSLRGVSRGNPAFTCALKWIAAALYQGLAMTYDKNYCFCITKVFSMASINPPVCDFGWQAPHFALPNVDGQMVSLHASKGKNGLLVMFICNHCPYVKAILPRLVADVRELQTLGVNTVAMMSNDPREYPEDSVENMKKIARELDFPFPYLLDASQQIAKDYGAVCTPDFFGFNNQLQLQYRGRFDESRKETASQSTRDLFNAMKLIAETGEGPREQLASIGCSIKWK